MPGSTARGKSSTEAHLREDLAERIRELIGPDRKVREVNMFGGLSFMVDELMAVSAGRDGGLLVRVDPASYDELIERGGTSAIMGKDRPMGNRWLMVPRKLIEDDKSLAFWVTTGIDSRNGPSAPSE